MNIGTKIGAKIAHFAEPDDMKMFTQVTTKIKQMNNGTPVKPAD